MRGVVFGSEASYCVAVPSFKLRASSFKVPSAITPPRAPYTTCTWRVPHEEVNTATILRRRVSISNKLALRSASDLTTACLVSMVA